MKCQILLRKKALHELKLRLETIGNEGYIDHQIVSIFCNLHHITQNYANLNNTDQSLLDFTNKNPYYDDDNDKHLPF